MAALKMIATTSNFIVSVEIDSPIVVGVALAGALSLGAFYLSKQYSVENAIRNGLEERNENGADPEVKNIESGSILVELYCHTSRSLLQFVDDLEAEKVKRRLEEEFSKIGFNRELNVTLGNAEEVYKKVQEIRFSLSREVTYAAEVREAQIQKPNSGQPEVPRGNPRKVPQNFDAEKQEKSGYQIAQQQDQPAGTLPPTGDSMTGKRSLCLLPKTVPHFVNRETECQNIKGHLSPGDKCRCLVIHGAKGMGKTTVAVKVANDILNSDRSTMVIYVDCRDIKLFDDFAAKIIQQVYHFPLDDPAAELKNRLKSLDSDTILLLDNFEFLPLSEDGKQPPESESSPQRLNPSEEGSKIEKLIDEILMGAGKVKLLLTSSEIVCFPKIGQETVRLTAFEPKESLELLKKVWKDGQVNTTKKQVDDFVEFCGGIPLVLFTLASSHNNLPCLLEEMKGSLPQQKIQLLRGIRAVPEGSKIDVCVDYCFGRLDKKQKCALISFALFRRRFSLSEVGEMFQSTKMSASDLRQCGLKLSRQSLLEEHITEDGCFYTFLRVIRDYCETKAMEPELREELQDARRMFTSHFLTFLEVTFKKFLSQKVAEAIAAFQMDEGNVLQLVKWCSNGGIDEEQRKRCIDVFNSVAELLAKMMGKAKFKDAFESLQRRCEEMEDQKRLSDCLTSLGIEEVFRIFNQPTRPCPSAAEGAKVYLTKADQIQCNLGISTGNSRAQCLSKLARCLAIEDNFEEAKVKVEQAIKIRLARGEEGKVMLGATYNDQAVILSLEENHGLAIKVREKNTLPIYSEKLGDHPFTATILNSLSNNYYALVKYDDAVRYLKDALKIRQKLLKDHRDTAKSLFDLGMTHKIKEELEPARICLEECEDMQKKILDENDNDLTCTRKELEDVKRRLVEAEEQSLLR